MTSERTPDLYSERLYAPWWWWVLGLGAGALGAAELRMGVPGWVPWVIVPAIVLLILLGLSRGRIRVTATDIHAGEHVLPLRSVATVEELDAVHTRRMRGPSADPAAPVCARPWLHGSVRVIPRQDSPPYLLITTRSPERLAAAIVAGVRSLDASAP